MRILVLHQGLEVASTRFRLAPFYPALQRAGFSISEYPQRPFIYYLGDRHYFSGYGYLKVFETLKTLLGAKKFDAVILQKYLLPPFLSFFDSLQARNPRLIWDIPDAIYHAPDAESPDPKRKARFESFVPLVKQFFVSNKFVAERVGRPKDTLIVPTTIDDGRFVPVSRKGRNEVVIGYSTSLLRFLDDSLAQLLSDFSKKPRVRVVIVTREFDTPHAQRLRALGLEVRRFRPEQEQADFHEFDIGISPLRSTPYDEGKFVCKTVCYMANALPVIGSPGASHEDQIIPGVTGFLPQNLTDWRTALEALTEDSELRHRLGEAGRERYQDRFSVSVLAPSLVERVAHVASTH